MAAEPQSAACLPKSIGYRNVKNVAGGLNAWVAGGLPT